MDERAFYAPIGCGLLSWAMFAPNSFAWFLGIFCALAMLVGMIDEISKMIRRR